MFISLLSSTHTKVSNKSILEVEKREEWCMVRDKGGRKYLKKIANGVQKDICDSTTTSKAYICRIFCEKSGKSETKKDCHQVPLPLLDWAPASLWVNSVSPGTSLRYNS